MRPPSPQSRSARRQPAAVGVDYFAGTLVPAARRTLLQRALAAPASPRPTVAPGKVDFSADQNEHKPRRRRGPARFRQVDTERAIAVAQKCGLAIAAIKSDGTIIVYDANTKHPFANADRKSDDIWDEPQA